MTLHQLQSSIQALLHLAFRPGTTLNHLQQVKSYLGFCDHYHLTFLDPPASTMCCYITFLTRKFKSARSVRNYVSGVNFLHKQLGIPAQHLHSFPMSCMLRDADLTMWVPPLHRLPILPGLLHQLCSLADDLGPLVPDMKVCLTFGWFGMLRQSNLASRSEARFDPKWNTCCGDVFFSPPPQHHNNHQMN